MTGADEKLLARIEDLEARRDIMDCVCRYMRGQDRLDPALQKSAFHPDAHVDCGPLAGSVDDFVVYAQSGLTGCAFTHHMIGQVQLTIDGDRAEGEVYFIAYHRMTLDGAEKDMIFGGRYIDEYRLREGQWRISRRKEIADWTRVDPAADDFFAMEPAYVRGGRRGEDFSDRRVWPA
nr:nuclear transport factor 2 family protein [Sphingomonas sp. CDS-1]